MIILKYITQLIETTNLLIKFVKNVSLAEDYCKVKIAPKNVWQFLLYIRRNHLELFEGIIMLNRYARSNYTMTLKQVKV